MLNRHEKRALRNRSGRMTVEATHMIEADWCGRPEKRFNWRTFRFEWGRMCYQTDCTGATLDRWFEFEKAHS